MIHKSVSIRNIQSLQRLIYVIINQAVTEVVQPLAWTEANQIVCLRIISKLAFGTL